jgi:hypothetical protein
MTLGKMGKWWDDWDQIGKMKIPGAGYHTLFTIAASKLETLESDT